MAANGWVALKAFLWFGACYVSHWGMNQQLINSSFTLSCTGRMRGVKGVQGVSVKSRHQHIVSIHLGSIAFDWRCIHLLTNWSFLFHALLDTVIHEDEVARYSIKAVALCPRFKDQEFSMAEGFHIPNFTFQLWRYLSFLRWPKLCQLCVCCVYVCLMCTRV